MFYQANMISLKILNVFNIARFEIDLDEISFLKHFTIKTCSN